jgi:lipopolysaccharide export system permease protein
MGEDGRSLTNIFVQMKHEGREKIWVARSGEYWVNEETGQRYIAMLDGQVTETMPRKLDVRVLTFERNDLKLPEPESRNSSPRQESRATGELLAEGSSSGWAEIQWRIAPAILAVVLGVLAIPLSHSAPREGRGSRVLLGILAYAVYVNILYLCRNWIADDLLPSTIGMWWIHGIVFLIALLLLQRQGRMVGSG